jgi:hypothetical protein
MDTREEVEAITEKMLIEGEEEEASAVRAKALVVPSLEAPTMGDEGGRASPLRPEATLPLARSPGGGAEGGSAPSSSLGPATGLGEPVGTSWALEVVGQPTGSEPRCASAIQATHQCLVRLGADLAAEEEELDAERARLVEV